MSPPQDPLAALLMRSQQIAMDVTHSVVMAYNHGFRQGLFSGGEYVDQVAQIVQDHDGLDDNTRAFLVNLINDIADRIKVTVHEISEPMSPAEVYRQQEQERRDEVDRFFAFLDKKQSEDRDAEGS